MSRIAALPALALARSLALSLGLAVTACSGSSSTARTEPGTGPAPTPNATEAATPAPIPGQADAAPPLDVSVLGQPCGEDGLCTAGTCERYYGIAGAKGPELSSCEIRCSKAEPCPTGTRCVTVADGPGEVCRP